MKQRKSRRGRNRRGGRQTQLKPLMVGFVIALAMVLFALAISQHHTATTAVQNTHIANASFQNLSASNINYTLIQQEVVPQSGFVLPARWGNSVKRLVDSGALNVSFLSKSLAQSNQSLTLSELEILNGTYDGNITMNQSNAYFTMIVLWALGINNKNPIIDNGPIMNSGSNPLYFASTGGYGPIGKLQLGNLSIINLTSNQQAVAGYVANNTYRPCCDNPTAFPDCNHGAAALAIVELMASQGASAQQIFKAIEEFNSIQFTPQYVLIAAYFASKNISWPNADPQTVMGANYSSLSGFISVDKYLSANKLLPSGLNGGSQSCGA